MLHNDDNSVAWLSVDTCTSILQLSYIFHIIRQSDVPSYFVNDVDVRFEYRITLTHTDMCKCGAGENYGVGGV